MATAVVIPARRDSARLHRKALAPIAGLSLVQRVRLRAIAADVGPVIVATDCEAIAADIRAHGGEVVITGPAANGTLRVAAAAPAWADVILNVQGDQPLLDPHHVRALATRMHTATIGTVVTRYTDDPEDTSVVEALLDADRAVDFVRRGPGRWRHLGLYGFTRAALEQVKSLPVCTRAVEHGLEQLTWLDAGLEIRVVEVEHAEPAVDTPAQLERVRTILGE